MIPTEREQLLADLRAIDALFSGPEKWTKHAWGIDDDGNPVHEFSDEAVCWCLASGIARVASNDEDDESSVRYRQQHDAFMLFGDVVAFNDAPETDFAAVKACIRRVIERVESAS